MAPSQFGNHDRKLVINQIERQSDVSLRSVGRHRKLLRTANGVWYCIVGGTGDWHGISESMIERIQRGARVAYLVVVVKMKDRYKIYLGDFQPLIDNRSELSYTAQENYQFHIDHDSDQVCLREIDGYCLELSAETSLDGVTISDRKKQKEAGLTEGETSEKEILKAFDTLSAKDQRLLLAKLTKRIK